MSTINEREKLLISAGFKRNPNTITVLWPGEESIPYLTSWSGGYQGMPTGDVLVFEWGFQVYITHGLIGPPSRMNFPKYVTEESFDGAFERLYAWMQKNMPPSIALGPDPQSWD